jgi:hypothetical protein
VINPLIFRFGITAVGDDVLLEILARAQVIQTDFHLAPFPGVE